MTRGQWHRKWSSTQPASLRSVALHACGDSGAQGQCPPTLAGDGHVATQQGREGCGVHGSAFGGGGSRMWETVRPLS